MYPYRIHTGDYVISTFRGVFTSYPLNSLRKLEGASAAVPKAE